MFDFKKTDQLQKNKFLFRAVAAGLFAVACFAVLVMRFWVLQVDRHDSLSARAENNRMAVVPIAPRRGDIFDRNGEVLARNVLSFTLEVVPAKAGNIDALLSNLTPIVYVGPADQRRFKRRVAESGRYASVVLRNSLNETGFLHTLCAFLVSNLEHVGYASTHKGKRLRMSLVMLGVFQSPI
jgi:penicillin-binding protein 2